jgi:hypothetical protein
MIKTVIVLVGTVVVTLALLSLLLWLIHSVAAGRPAGVAAVTMLKAT